MKIIYFFVFILLMSCSLSKKDHEDAVAEWVGNELIIPSSVNFKILESDLDIDLQDFDYKIVNFIDSSDCISCKMNLPSWDEILCEFHSLLDEDIDIEVFTIVNGADTTLLNKILHRYCFLHPVALDTDNMFKTLNKISQRSEYHTFLLDCNNEVLCIGNPVWNPKIKELYKGIILDNKKSHNYGSVRTQTLGLVSYGDTLSTTFAIPNYDSTSFKIQAMIPSCHCVSIVSNKNVVQPGTEAVFEIKLFVDSITGHIKRYVDVFYEERDYPDRLLICYFSKYN